MPYTEASKKAAIKYQKANYDNLSLRFRKGEKQRYYDHAELMGEKPTEFIRRALEETLQRDREKIQARMKGE